MTNTTTHIPDEAVQAGALALRHSGSDTLTDMARTVLTAAAPYLTASVEVKPEDIQLIERMAYGYEVMLETLYHIAGTSGAPSSWYTGKAQQTTGRVSPLHSVSIDSNKPVNGDCKRQYIDFMSRILSCVVTKPVDVAAVRRQAFEEGFENGVEQSLNALNAYDDITRNEAEQGIRKLKPDYRALSAEPAQASQWKDMRDAPKDGFEFIARCGADKPSFSCFWDGSAFMHYSHGEGYISYSPTEWTSFPAPTTEAQS